MVPRVHQLYLEDSKIKRMQTYSPIEYTPRLWEGTELPPLRMVGEGVGYIPNGFVPESQLTAAPEAEAALAPAPVATLRRKEAGNSFLRQIALLLVFGMLCVGAYYIISRYVITPVVIQGRSMTPTLRDGECYFLNRWIYIFKTPARGDLVVIKDPGHDDFAVKRIIARPGAGYFWQQSQSRR